MNPTLQYTVRFPAPATHYAEIEASFPATAGQPLELMMAVWTPGSYLVREYAKNLEALRAEGSRGEPLTITKTAKNRWRVEAGSGDRVTVHYRLYCHELSVRTNWVDDQFALLIGAATFLTLPDGLDLPHQVGLELSEGWSQASAALPESPESTARTPIFVAKDFDQLVDSPIHAGSPAVYDFEVDGIPHQLINDGENGTWDGPRSAEDTQRIVEEQIAFWGAAPYPRFLFFNLITEGRGGLEHKDSTVLMTSQWATRTRESYLGWLGLVSHELFHAWNGKRLRPLALGPFDFENEVYTRDLWVVEGITSYYDDLLVHRSGITTRKEYLKALSRTLKTVQTTPGRNVQPLSDASFDAWIKLYRRDENSANVAMSYYSKGAAVAWLLDMSLRRASDDSLPLDAVMREAYTRFSDERGYGEGEFRALVGEMAATKASSEEAQAVDAYLRRAFETAEELDYQPALSWLGLRWKAKDSDEDSEEAKNGDSGSEAEEETGWLGLVTRTDEGRLLVREVRRETPVHAAGLSPGDELLALDQFRVPADGWEKQLERYRPGQSAELLVARRGRLVTLSVTFGTEPEQSWELEIDPDATPEQQRRLAAWLGDETSSSEQP